MVLTRTGSRICGLLGVIGLLFLGARTAWLVSPALLRILGLVRPRRPHGLAGEDEHVAAAIYAGRRPADHLGEAVLLVALDVHYARDRKAGRIDAVDAGGHEAIARMNLGVGR